MKKNEEKNTVVRVTLGLHQSYPWTALESIIYLCPSYREIIKHDLRAVKSLFATSARYLRVQSSELKKKEQTIIKRNYQFSIIQLPSCANTETEETKGKKKTNKATVVRIKKEVENKNDEYRERSFKG